MADEIIIETVSAEVIEVGVPGPQGPAGAAGTGLETLTTRGDTLYRGTTTGERLPIGATGQILRVSASGIPEWGSTPASGVSSVNGVTGAVTLDGSDIDTSGNDDLAAFVTYEFADGNGIYYPLPDSTLNSKRVYRTTTGHHVFFQSLRWHITDGSPITANIIESSGDDNAAWPWLSAWDGSIEKAQLSTVVGRARNTFLFVGDNIPTTSVSGLATVAASGDYDDLTGKPTIPTTSTATPSALGTAAAGTSANFARADHVHAMPNASSLLSTGAGEGDLPVAQGDGSIAWQNGTTWAGLNITAQDIGAAFDSHTHGNLTNDGRVGTTSGLPLKTGTAGVVEAGAFGTSAGQFAEGNHTHADLHTRSHAITSTSDHTAGNHKIFYSNGSGEIVELALGDSGKVLTSNGTAAAPSFAAGFNAASPPAIGSTTPAAGTFTTLTANNGTLAASAPVLDLAQTWNASGVTFTGLRFNVTNTASATASNIADFQVGGASVTSIRRDGSIRFGTSGNIALFSTPSFSVTSGAGGVWMQIGTTCGFSGSIIPRGNLQMTDGTGSNPAILDRDAADILAQRNLANPQTFRIYNTTDAGLTNHERGFLRWSSNVLQIGTEKGSGGGTARALEIRTDNTARLTFGSAGTVTLNTTLAADAQNISTDTTTGTKIGTGTTQKIGFFNATPVVQQAAVADATDAASTQARLNDLLARLRTLGLIAT